MAIDEDARAGDSRPSPSEGKLQIWPPPRSLRITCAVIGFASAAIAAWLAGIAMLHGEWAGTLFVLLTGSIMVGPALGVAFYVRLAFDGRRLTYRSAHPAVAAKSDARVLQLVRFAGLNYFGIPLLRIVDSQGRVLLSAPCIWSEQQVSEIAHTLGVPLERS